MGFWMDKIHTGLDVVGMIPAVGNVADLANAGLYVLEGDIVNAGISVAGAIPGVGQAATGARIAKKVGKEVLEEVAEQGAKKVAKEVTEEVAEQGAKKAGKEVGEETAEAGAKNIGTKVSESPPVDVNLKYKDGWTDAQKAAADKKAKALSEADTTVVKSPERSGTTQSRYRKDSGLDSTLDADHVIDLQVGGADTMGNMQGLDKSVNRSVGSQINNQIKNLPEGTPLGDFKFE